MLRFGARFLFLFEIVVEGMSWTFFTAGSGSSSEKDS